MNRCAHLFRHSLEWPKTALWRVWSYKGVWSPVTWRSANLSDLLYTCALLFSAWYLLAKKRYIFEQVAVRQPRRAAGHRLRARGHVWGGMCGLWGYQNRGTAAMPNQIFTGGRGPLVTACPIGWPLGLPLLACGGAVAGYVWPGWRNWLRAKGLRLAVGYAGPCRFT